MDNPFEELDQKLDLLSNKLDDLKCQVVEQISRKEVLTIEGVEEYTGLKRSTILKHKRGGNLKHHKQGGRLYFQLDDIVDWLTENQIDRRTKEQYKKDRKIKLEKHRQEAIDNLKKYPGYDP